MSYLELAKRVEAHNRADARMLLGELETEGSTLAILDGVLVWFAPRPVSGELRQLVTRHRDALIQLLTDQSG